MARILETFKRNEAGARPATVDSAEMLPRMVAPPEAPGEDIGEEMPYVEVGGGRLDGSPSVLAMPARKPALVLPAAAAQATPAVMLQRDVSGEPRAESQTAPHATPAVMLQRDGSGEPRAESQTAPHAAPAVMLQPLTPAELSLVRDRMPAELVAFHHPEHALSQQYRQLAASLTEAATTRDQRVLLFTAFGQEPNATTVVLNLAISAAQCHLQRVVVVDMAGSCSRLADLMCVAVSPGLQEVLAGILPVSRAVQRTGQTHLHLLTCGAARTSACWAVKSLRWTLAQLRKRYQLVFVLAPDQSGGAEIAAIGAVCDSAYMIAPRAQAESAAVKEKLQAMLHQGIGLRGCILVQT